MQNDHARPHIAKTFQETLQVFNWEILPHPPYSPDIGPPDYHSFKSMHSAHLRSAPVPEGSNKMGRPMDCFQGTRFFYHGIHLLPENGKTLYFSMESILNEIYLFYYFNFYFTFYKKTAKT